MSREKIYKEMKEMLGVVPSMFKEIPDSTLELEWRLFKQVQFEPGPIPNKYRELIGLGISAVTKCKYCLFFHTELAKLNGATQAEIEDAIHYAKSSVGWSAYMSGHQLNFDKFKKEILHACEYVKKKERTQKKKKLNTRGRGKLVD